MSHQYQPKHSGSPLSSTKRDHAASLAKGPHRRWISAPGFFSAEGAGPAIEFGEFVAVLRGLDLRDFDREGGIEQNLPPCDQFAR